jgi:putative ABC transport system substrate-binding protein
MALQRREFIGLLSGVVAAWPFVAHAQQSETPVIGSLGSISAGTYMFSAIRRGLSEQRCVDGCNVKIEYRSAGGHYDRLPHWRCGF